MIKCENGQTTDGNSMDEPLIRLLDDEKGLSAMLNTGVYMHEEINFKNIETIH